MWKIPFMIHEKQPRTIISLNILFTKNYISIIITCKRQMKVDYLCASRGFGSDEWRSLRVGHQKLWTEVRFTLEKLRKSSLKTHSRDSLHFLGIYIRINSKGSKRNFKESTETTILMLLQHNSLDQAIRSVNQHNCLNSKFPQKPITYHEQNSFLCLISFMLPIDLLIPQKACYWKCF